MLLLKTTGFYIGLQSYEFLESEINKGAESGGVERGNAKIKGECRHHPGDEMLPVGVVGEIHTFLKFLSEFRQGDEREEDGNKHGDIEAQVPMNLKRREVEGKHPSHKGKGVRQILDPEKHPKNCHNEESGENGKRKTENGKLPAGG